MGRWDFLADRKPQALREYVLDQVAERLVEELRGFPPPIEEWLDARAHEKFRDVLARETRPELDTLRVACELARLELLREVEVTDRFWRSAQADELLRTALEKSTAHFLIAWLVDAALAFQEHGKGKFKRADLVSLIERVEERLLRGYRLRL